MFLQTLKLINMTLDNKFTQWVLLICFILSMICLLWVYILCNSYKVELALAKSKNADLESSIAVQNAAIEKARLDYMYNKKRLDAAVAKATKLEKQRQSLPPLTGSCEEMVKRTMDTIVSNMGG